MADKYLLPNLEPSFKAFINKDHLCPEMHAVTKMHQNLQICQADFAMKNSTKFCQNCQFHHSDFALRNLTDIRQNHEIHKYSLGSKKFH